MPEGPEIYVSTQVLQRRLKGKEILKFDITLPRYQDEKLNTIVPCRIIDVICKGKQIFFILNHNNTVYYINSRLAMEGRFHWDGEHKHTHIRIEVKNDKTLYFDESRPFGAFKLMTEKEGKEKMSKIGIEPLRENIEPKYFIECLEKRSRWMVCDFLMDQDYISGIGNYLKSEILYYARIRPDRKIDTLTTGEVIRLYQYIHKIPRDSYQWKGLTIRSYWSPDGTRGTYPCKVYGRAGQNDEYGYLIKRKEFSKKSRTSFYVDELQN